MFEHWAVRMPRSGGHRPGCLPASSGSPGTDTHSPRGKVSTALPSGTVSSFISLARDLIKSCA